MTHPVLQRFENRHARCIATDREYSDAEMVPILLNVMKRNYIEDREDLLTLINELENFNK